MKSVILTLLLIFATLFAIAQDNYDASLIPTSLKSRANAVVRKQETVVDMQAVNDVVYKVKKAVTVLNANGEDYARLVLSYDKNTNIKSAKGEVFDEFGKLTAKISLSDFKDESAVHGFSLFEDSRVKHFSPAVSSYPYTIVYNYELRFKQNLIIPDWTPKLADDVAVENSNYTFISKPTDELQIKSQHYNGEVRETNTDKQHTLFWEVNQIPAIKPEPYRPNRENYLTQIKIAPKQFSYFNYKGSYSNWNELGKWYGESLLKGRDELPASTIQMMKNLVVDAKSDKEKAKKIYKYVQDKTRYISVQIGIGGFQPVKAADVDRLGYGDCKGLVNYTQALLKAVGVESYYCVVEAGSEKIDLDPTYASMNQGNHVILCLPLKNDTTWLECTSQTIPFGYLGDFTDDRFVLAVTPEGGKLMKTTLLSTAQNLQTRHAKLTLNTKGELTGNVTTVFSGSQYENNEELIGKPIIEQTRMLKRIYDIDQINFNAISYQQQKTELPVLTEKLAVTIENFGPKNPEKLSLQLNIFNIQQSIPEVKNRQMPVSIKRGFTDIDTILYEIPKNAVLLNLPTNTKLSNEFGHYTVATKLEGQILTYIRKLVINSGTFPASKYAEFVKLMSEIRSLDHLKFTFSLKE